MPTDTGGNYTLPSGSVATTGTTILASELNTPLNDIASALSARLPVDGSKGMSGPLRVSDGTVSAPGVALGSETGTGFYKIGSGQWGLSIAGTLVATFDASGVTIAGGITYLKLQNVTSGALLGNFSGIGASPAEITLGAGLKTTTKTSTVTITIATPGVVTWSAHGLAANTPVVLTTDGILPTGLAASTVYYVLSPATNTFQLSVTPGGAAINTTGVQSGTHTATSTTVIAAPAFPPPAAYKKLSIKVTGNTGATLAADFIAVTDGTSYQTLAFSQAIDFTTTGAGALDTGTVASAAWYAIWAIAKADGTASAIASTSATSPTMPSGYTYKARVGWVRTANSSAQLHGTWQFGRRAQYIIGLAQTANAQTAGSGVIGTWSATAPTWASLSISSLVPSTASVIQVSVSCSGAEDIIVAPNASYTGAASSSPPPIVNNSSTGHACVLGSFILESTNIYAASAGGQINVLGWEDNI